MNKINITNNFMKVKEILFEWGYKTNDIKNLLSLDDHQLKLLDNSSGQLFHNMMLFQNKCSWILNIDKMLDICLKNRSKKDYLNDKKNGIYDEAPITILNQGNIHDLKWFYHNLCVKSTNLKDHLHKKLNP